MNWKSHWNCSRNRCQHACVVRCPLKFISKYCGPCSVYTSMINIMILNNNNKNIVKYAFSAWNYFINNNNIISFTMIALDWVLTTWKRQRQRRRRHRVQFRICQMKSAEMLHSLFHNAICSHEQKAFACVCVMCIILSTRPYFCAVWERKKQRSGNGVSIPWLISCISVWCNSLRLFIYVFIFIQMITIINILFRVFHHSIYLFFLRATRQNRTRLTASMAVSCRQCHERR